LATTPTIDTDRVVHDWTRPPGRRRLRWFFSAVSGVLLAALVIGFAPSFFLRGRINTPLPLLSMPAYLVAHGVVLTTWFALVFAQTCLVGAGRTDLHRRLGIVGLGIAILVVPISALVVVRAVPRLLAVGVEREALFGIILGDFVSLALFGVLVGAAAYTRENRRDIHKRCMIASCFMIYGPVMSRLGNFYGLHAPWFTHLVVPLLGLGVYDAVTLGRIHRATVWSAIVAPVVFVVVSLILILSGAADAVIDALR
jgi:hypothetical protein